MRTATHTASRTLPLAAILAAAACMAAAPVPPATTPATNPSQATATAPAATSPTPPARGARGGRGARGVAGAPQVQPTTPNPADVEKVEAALPTAAPAAPAKPRKVLAFGKATGFQHGSIPLGVKTVELLGNKTHAYTTTMSFDPAIFTPEKLAEFDAIVLVSTTGSFLDVQSPTQEPEAISKAKTESEKRRAAFEAFIKDGKGVAGIHAASDAYYDWPEYGSMIGGYFSRHTSGMEKISVQLDDPTNPINAAFDGKPFDFADEIYRFVASTNNGQNRAKQSYNRENLHVLLSVDTTKNRNEPAGVDMPISWTHAVGKGRVFYCSLGHNNYVYWNTPVLNHYLAGIQYAIGDLKADDKLPTK
jgi:type 1 glutamine amidotransferase